MTQQSTAAFNVEDNKNTEAAPSVLVQSVVQAINHPWINQVYLQGSDNAAYVMGTIDLAHKDPDSETFNGVRIPGPIMRAIGQMKDEMGNAPINWEQAFTGLLILGLKSLNVPMTWPDFEVLDKFRTGELQQARQRILDLGPLAQLGEKQQDDIFYFDQNGQVGNVFEMNNETGEVSITDDVMFPYHHSLPTALATATLIYCETDGTVVLSKRTNLQDPNYAHGGITAFFGGLVKRAEIQTIISLIDKFSMVDEQIAKENREAGVTIGYGSGEPEEEIEDIPDASVMTLSSATHTLHQALLIHSYWSAHKEIMDADLSLEEFTKDFVKDKSKKALDVLVDRDTVLNIFDEDDFEEVPELDGGGVFFNVIRCNKAEQLKYIEALGGTEIRMGIAMALYPEPNGLADTLTRTNLHVAQSILTRVITG